MIKDGNVIRSFDTAVTKLNGSVTKAHVTEDAMVQLLKKPAYGTVESQKTTLKAIYDKGEIIKDIFDKSDDADV